MKLKEWLQFFGLKPKTQSFSSSTQPIELSEYAHLFWTEWQHPKAKKAKPRFEDCAILSRFLKKGDFVIDIGAHVGDTTLPYAHLVGKEGACLALEPNPAAFAVLKENAENNREHLNIIALQAAAMENEGTHSFYYNDPGLCNGGSGASLNRFEKGSFYEVKVKGINLEHYLTKHLAKRREQLSFIKTDVEGYDHKLFRYNRPLIEDMRPYLQMEVHKSLSYEEKKDFVDELKSLNYCLYTIPDVTLASMTAFQPDDLERKKTFDLFACPLEKPSPL